MSATEPTAGTFVYLGRFLTRAGKLAHRYLVEEGPEALLDDDDRELHFAKALTPGSLVGHRYTVLVQPNADGGWYVVGGHTKRAADLAPMSSEERAPYVASDRAALAAHEAKKTEKRLRSGELEDLGDLTLGALRAQMRKALPHQRAALLAVALDYLR